MTRRPAVAGWMGTLAIGALILGLHGMGPKHAHSPPEMEESEIAAAGAEGRAALLCEVGRARAGELGTWIGEERGPVRVDSRGWAHLAVPPGSGAGVLQLPGGDAVFRWTEVRTQGTCDAFGTVWQARSDPQRRIP